MRRFYLSDIIGDGTDAPVPWTDTTGPYRPSALDHGPVREYIQLGTRMLVWAEVDDAQHAALIADPRTHYVPFEDSEGNPLPVSASLAEIAPDHRDTIRDWLEARNVPVADLGENDTIRTVLRRTVARFRLAGLLGGHDFTEVMTMTVGSIPAAKRQRIIEILTSRGYDVGFATGGMTVRDFLRGLLDQDRAFRYLGAD